MVTKKVTIKHSFVDNVLILAIYSVFYIADPNDPGYNGLGEVCYKRARKNPSVNHIFLNFVKTSEGIVNY